MATVKASGHTFTLAASIAGKTPAKAASMTTVKMTGFQAEITIPASLIQVLEQSGMTWISGSAFTFDINASDAVTKSKNAGTGLSIPKTSLAKPAANFTFTVPATAKTVGPWTAAAKGTMVFTDGKLKFTLNDNLGSAVPVSCSPKPAVTLSKTTVS